MSNQADILVSAEYRWTCQSCLTVVMGFADESEALEDSQSHMCEVY